MTPRQLKRTARRRQTAASILSDGSRSYFVELRSNEQVAILSQRPGEPMCFSSLAQAQQLLAKCGVTDVVLKTRVAAAEACADALAPNAQFATLQLSSPDSQ